LKTIKKIIIAIIVILFMVMASCEPEEPAGDMVPYMSDITYIPCKVSAKGKVKKKMFRRSEYDSLGTYTLTAYCNCARCCGRAGGKTASGTTPKAEYTIAVDPKVIPYGTAVWIRGKKYVAEDCGGGVRGKHIDIFFDSHSEALKFGKQKAEVFKRKSPQLLYKMKLVKIDNLKKVARKGVKSFGSIIKSRRNAR
jgi:3D (Asp-Asp-Asp) domain-containing protein